MVFTLIIVLKTKKMLDWRLAGSVREDVSSPLAGYPYDGGDKMFFIDKI